MPLTGRMDESRHAPRERQGQDQREPPSPPCRTRTALWRNSPAIRDLHPGLHRRRRRRQDPLDLHPTVPVGLHEAPALSGEQELHQERRSSKVAFSRPAARSAACSPMSFTFAVETWRRFVLGAGASCGPRSASASLKKAHLGSPELIVDRPHRSPPTGQPVRRDAGRLDAGAPAATTAGDSRAARGLF